MRSSFLLALVWLVFAVLGAGCSDSFNPTPLPDLGKKPYDFAVAVPPYPYDMSIGDMSTND